MATIRIKCSLRGKTPATASIKKRIKTLLLNIGLHETELSVLFVGDHAMRRLNRTWRGKDSTTDVLAFSFREGKFGNIQSTMLGDIVLSVPRARFQARAAGHTLTREIERLLIHGLTHLLGYDHERGAKEARRMERKERQLLNLLA